MSTHSKKRPWLLAMLIATLVGLLWVAWAASSPLLVGIGNWFATTPLPQALASRDAVVNGDFVYVIGGKNATDSPVGSIYSAQVKVDGSIDRWNVAAQLPVPVYLQATAATSTHLYIVGGWDGTRTRSEVWRAPFQAGGTLGAFQKVSDYPTTIDLHEAVIVQNRLYVLGGWNGTEGLNIVRYADIQSDGLGPWVTVNSLPSKIYRLAVTAYNDVIYVTGGYDGVARTQVYFAKVHTDGSIDPWQETTALPNALYYHDSIVHDGRLMVLGGKNDAGEFKDVYAATISANGTIGAWSAQPALPESLYRFAAVTFPRNGSDFVGVFGGLHNVDYRNNVYHSTAPTPATPTNTPTRTPTPTPTPVQGIALQLANNPQRWVAPNEEVVYTITYRNTSAQSIANVMITDIIPSGVELVPDSIQASNGGSFVAQGSSPGDAIIWTLGEVAGNASGQVGYRVRRSLPPTPAVPRPLSIRISGPASAQPGEAVEYTIALTNSTFLTFTNLVIVDTLPIGAHYVSGADSQPSDNTVRWNVPVLLGEETATRTLVVTADRSIVNYSYYASSDEGPTVKGRTVVATFINDTDPPPPGDGTQITKQGAIVSWEVANQRKSTTSNGVYNPSFSSYLPVVKK